jgi:hypothetical protein
MTDRELLQMALDALEYPGPSWFDSRQAIADALRASLAQTEPWVKTYSGGKPNYTQPEPEPVAWGVDEGEGRCISLHDLYFVKKDADHMAELKGTHAKVVALYASPPQPEPQETISEWIKANTEHRQWYICPKCSYQAPRFKDEWVGLTNEEIDTWDIVGHESLRDFVRAVEAKLKEKNT